MKYSKNWKGGSALAIYKTAQIAKLIGVHPNTIRFYEEMQLLPVIPRTESGYRIFNERHLEQLRLLRTAFRAEIISDKLRQEVYEIVKRIPKGKVMSYGQIAKLLGRPKSARVVGWALHSNPDSNNIPCHRVVNGQGMISSGYAFGGPEIQRKLLEREGIIFETDGKINLEIYGFRV
jgi:methylated-DNA-protein-cysteine methyltransferase-like protein